MTIDEAIKALREVIRFVEAEDGYDEFKDDLYSLLDAFDEDSPLPSEGEK